MQGGRHGAPASQISFIAFLFPLPSHLPKLSPGPGSGSMTSVWKAGLRSSRAAVMTQHSHLGCGSHSDLGSWLSQMCWYLHCWIISWVSVSLVLEICSIALVLNMPCFCLFRVPLSPLRVPNMRLYPLFQLLRHLPSPSSQVLLIFKFTIPHLPCQASHSLNPWSHQPGFSPSILI